MGLLGPGFVLFLGFVECEGQRKSMVRPGYMTHPLVDRFRLSHCQKEEGVQLGWKADFCDQRRLAAIDSIEGASVAVLPRPSTSAVDSYSLLECFSC